MSDGSQSGGVGFAGLLAILFIGLRLGAVIDWSWWWVLCPIWAPAALGIAILAGVGLYLFVKAMVEAVSDWRVTRRRLRRAMRGDDAAAAGGGR